MKKPTRKTPQSVKTQRKIDAAVDLAAAEKTKYYHSLLTQQSRRHVAEMGELKQSFVSAELIAESSDGMVVPNWKQGWKWFSNLALAAIVAINTSPIPPEIIDALPPDARQQVTIGLAVVGILGCFINQSRKKDVADVRNTEI